MIQTKNNVISRIISFVTASIMLLSMMSMLVSCEKKNTISVWVYSEECKDQIEEFLKTTKLKVSFNANIHVVNSSDFSDELNKAIEQKQNIPDVFMISPDNISEYVMSDITEDVSELGINVNTDNYYGYTIDAATNSDGVMKAVGWQADPGIFMYRRSMALAYLGTDSPDDIQEMISTWQGFYDTAKKVYSHSGGKTRMLAGQEDMIRPYLSSGGNVWTNDNRLIISDTVKAYIDYVGQMSENHLMYTAEQWSKAWLAGISDTRSVFGYFSSGICMEYAMKKACGGAVQSEGSYGDWAVVPGPAGYFWGGSWLAAYSGTKYKNEAADFIKIFTACTDDMSEFDESVKYFRTTGNFSANREVVRSIRFDPQFEDSFIGGQNYYQQLSIVAEKVPLKEYSVYDTRIFEIFNSCMNDYAGGFKSREQALSDFKTSVGVAFPELNIN